MVGQTSVWLWDIRSINITQQHGPKNRWGQKSALSLEDCAGSDSIFGPPRRVGSALPVRVGRYWMANQGVIFPAINWHRYLRIFRPIVQATRLLGCGPRNWEGSIPQTTYIIPQRHETWLLTIQAPAVRPHGGLVHDICRTNVLVFPLA